MKIMNNGKVIFNGAFDVSKLVKESMEFDGETLNVRYNDSNLLKALNTVLYDFMSTEMGWKDNDSDKTELYLCGDVYESDFSIVAFCKPLPYEESDFLPEDVKSAMDDYDFQMWKLNNFGSGFEVTSISIELTDFEQKELQDLMISMNPKMEKFA